MNCSICSSLVLFVALIGAEVQGAGIRPSMTINIRDGSIDGLEVRFCIITCVRLLISC